MILCRTRSIFSLATFLPELMLATAICLATINSAGAVSHELLDKALHARVQEGRVNYPQLAADSNYHAYVSLLKSTDAEQIANREEALSFWINAYNALAIKGILDGSSPSSFFGRIGYFSGAVYEVGGREINLYDLERKVLIPMGEPRIHFAINCASLSCPILQSSSYMATTLNQQLDQAARRFINDTDRNRFDRSTKVAHLSKIFDWFDDEFSGDDGEAGILRYVAQYIADQALAKDLLAGNWRIEHLEYDWSLNGIPPKADD